MRPEIYAEAKKLGAGETARQTAETA